jgi:hypothetical protein
MSAVFDIQAKLNAILEADDLVKIKGMGSDTSVFDAQTCNGLFDGNVPSGITLKGERALLVQGTVLGTDNNLCSIDIKEDVIVTGDALHARIHGFNIHVACNLQHSHLIASGDIKIGTDLVSSQLVAGDFEASKQRINELSHGLHQAQEEHENLQRRVKLEERRMDKACTITRTPLNFNVGRIVQQKYNRVRIDLKNFYQSFSEHPTKNVEQALKEFFAKGIVGVLARANQKYLTNNPGREKIFLELLKKLRELFLLVHQYETLNNRMSHDEQIIGQLLNDLNAQERTIYVQGSLAPDSELVFMLPNAVRQEDGSTDFKHQSVHLKVTPGADEEHLHLELQNASGEKTNQDLSRAEFNNLSFQVHEGEIVWKSLQSRDPQAAV